jgi:hypothetical protein
MSDPFTDPSFTSNTSTKKDIFSDFTSFDQLGKNKKKASKWTGFKESSVMEKKFQNFDFNDGQNLQKNNTFQNEHPQNHFANYKKFDKPSQATTQYANVNININNNNININGQEKFYEQEMSSQFYQKEQPKKTFDNFNNINFSKQKYKTPFDDEEDTFSGRVNQAQNIFGGLVKKNQRPEKMMKSDEFNPFDDEHVEVKAKDMIKGNRNQWMGFQSQQPQNHFSTPSQVPHFSNQQSVEAQFDNELEESKKKRYIESPFEIRVEDKVESAYEYIGRKIKEGGKALKKLDKKVLKWIKPEEKEKKMPVNSNLMAEVQSNSINTFIGGQSLGAIQLDTNRKVNLNLEQMMNKIKNDKPLVKRIRTKQDLQRQKRLERASNPFEEDFDLPIPPPQGYESTDHKLQKYFNDGPSYQQKQVVQPISTPFLDDFTKDDFNFDDDNTFSNKNNIFAKPSRPIQSQKKMPRIFDEYSAPQLSQSTNFARRQNPMANANPQNSTIQKVMANDFLNFDELDDGAKYNKNQDPFADDLF